jgi:hypothetical protein
MKSIAPPQHLVDKESLGYFRSYPAGYPDKLCHRTLHRKYLKLLVPQEGFEPPTPSLRMMCSAD